MLSALGGAEGLMLKCTGAEGWVDKCIVSRADSGMCSRI